jgi:hypothetical protein
VTLPICFRHLSGRFTAGICSYLLFANISEMKAAENTRARFCSTPLKGAVLRQTISTAA